MLPCTPQPAGGGEHWGAPPLRCRALNHVALGANDVHALERFYTQVGAGAGGGRWEQGG